MCAVRFNPDPVPLRKNTRDERTRDHFVPKAVAGVQFGAVNIWHLCRDCNETKADRLPDTAATVAFSISKGFCKL